MIVKTNANLPDKASQGEPLAEMIDAIVDLAVQMAVREIVAALRSGGRDVARVSWLRELERRIVPDKPPERASEPKPF